MLSLPFFGSGMVNIPPGGEKRVKNSGRMQLVFFVFRGRVTVDVAGMAFGIGQGGMWQVPRGEFYSFYVLQTCSLTLVSGGYIGWVKGVYQLLFSQLKNLTFSPPSLP